MFLPQNQSSQNAMFILLERKKKNNKVNKKKINILTCGRENSYC